MPSQTFVPSTQALQEVHMRKRPHPRTSFALVCLTGAVILAMMIWSGCGNDQSKDPASPELAGDNATEASSWVPCSRTWRDS